MDEPWVETTLNDWHDFSNFIDKFRIPREGEFNRFIFRGQADADWPLKPSLLRICENVGINHPTIAELIEQKALRDFISQAHIYIDPLLLPSYSTLEQLIDKRAWWEIMQHHNAPTRLLDWTKSEYVAAYFAVEKEINKPGAIWIVEPGAIHDRISESISNNGSLTTNAPENQIRFFQPQRPNIRMIAQQGWFSVAEHSIFSIHSDGIARAVSGHASRKWIHKVIIPAELKMLFLRKLRTMNITASSLFPGADGLGRSIAELIIFNDPVDHSWQ